MMARITHVLRQVADRGSSSVVKASGKLNNQHRDNNSGFQTCAEMVAQIEALLEAREQALKEREEALEKRFQLFESTYPQAGNPSDVLHLNVGGSTNVAVLRRTLTHFENSILGCVFSGRWDDKLERTKCGSFFLDHDPNVFLPLLNYLRYCDQKTPNKMKIPPPPPTLEFCAMLEYYGLMSHVYPQKWRRVSDNGAGVVMTREATEGDSLTISSSNKRCAFALDVIKPLTATSFTAELEAGSKGQVGWVGGLGPGQSLGNDPSVRSAVFDVDKGVFRIDGCRRRRLDGTLSSRLPVEYPVTIQCTRDVTANTCSFQVLDGYSDDSGRGTFSCPGRDVSPYITFQGKVTLSDVSYSCDSSEQ